MLPQYNVAGSLSCLAALRADIKMTNYLQEGPCRQVLIHHHTCCSCVQTLWLRNAAEIYDSTDSKLSHKQDCFAA